MTGTTSKLPTPGDGVEFTSSSARSKDSKGDDFVKDDAILERERRDDDVPTILTGELTETKRTLVQPQDRTSESVGSSAFPPTSEAAIGVIEATQSTEVAKAVGKHFEQNDAEADLVTTTVLSAVGNDGDCHSDESVEDRNPRTPLSDYFQQMSAMQRDAFERLYENTVDRPCRSITDGCDPRLDCPQLSFFFPNGDRPHGASSVDPSSADTILLYSRHASIGPTSCEYCGASSLQDCNPEECSRPRLFFLKKKPPFASSDGWDRRTEYRLDPFEGMFDVDASHPSTGNQEKSSPGVASGLARTASKVLCSPETMRHTTMGAFRVSSRPPVKTVGKHDAAAQGSANSPRALVSQHGIDSRAIRSVGSSSTVGGTTQAPTAPPPRFLKGLLNRYDR